MLVGGSAAKKLLEDPDGVNEKPKIDVDIE